MNTDKRIAIAVLSVLLMLTGHNVWAGEPAQQLPEQPLEVEAAKTYLLGVSEFEADDFTTITGWQLTNSWYIGHQDGEEDSGLSLLWQQERDQMSISSTGIRFTHRF